MDLLIDAHLERLAELADIELPVPRTRTFSALKVVRASTRRDQA